MRIPLLTFTLVTTVVAFPWPFTQDAQVTSLPAVSARPTATKTHVPHHVPHREPTPSFKQSCECSQPIIPIDVLTPFEKCQMEFSNRMACYYRAQGGCALPTLAC
ncbi:hypothetical protein K504DRAFT_423435 [Pleomassaria siparia CBS 279.74]|uniref:Uncharacterized protein n=1 Tax=Pleomassaria siparia CBS 279.74 TaxID=1314801 RepID=A0A6G1KKK8_9PLEO|nr:hypothetical protein K504DRAFT_423435 [Pleomassaria siparia CBS 279.74]